MTSAYRTQQADCKPTTTGAEQSALPLLDFDSAKATESPRQQLGLDQGLSSVSSEGLRPLGNTANNYGKPSFPQVTAADIQRAQKRSATRAEMGKIAKWLRYVSVIGRVRACRTYSVNKGGAVQVRQSEKGVGFAGLNTCGSAWSCPRCNQKIMATRRKEIEVMLNNAYSRGYTTAMVTMTLRHRQGQPLKELWDTLQKCWVSVGGSRKVRRIRQELKFLGCVRLVEVTYGDNGWHPHIHAIYVFEKPVSQADLERLRDAELAQWKTTAVKRGLGAPNHRGMKIERIGGSKKHRDKAISDYFSKVTWSGMSQQKRTLDSEKAAWEMASPATKRGRRKGSRTPFQILRDSEESHLADDVDIWNEYEEASRGRKMFSWSQKLKPLRMEEKTDQELADEEIGSKEDDVLEIQEWHQVMLVDQQRFDIDVPSSILNVLDQQGVVACANYCRSLGIDVKLNHQNLNRRAKERVHQQTVALINHYEGVS